MIWPNFQPTQKNSALSPLIQPLILEIEVTPITYRHLLLISQRSGKSPVFLGPMLVHYRKDFRTFLYFASTVVGLCPQLERLQAFGTDGETALIEAMAHEFGFATHLLCAIHLRRNIKQQLHDLNFPVEHRRKVLDEIFGGRRGSVYLEGLIDAKSAEDLDLKLAALKPEWDQRECEQSGCVARFHNWFLAHKAEDFKSSAIHPVRERCGLGIPPDTFTTNASETINSVLKSKVDYKKSDLPNFVDKMRSLVDEQQQELERAICKRGKYRFTSQYQHLEVEEGKWFNLTPERRRKHLEKVCQTALAASGDVSSVVGEQRSTTPSLQSALCGSSSSLLPFKAIEGQPQASENPDEVVQALSVDVDSFANVVKTPRTVLDGIWTKAAELLSVPHKIVPAPGCNALARMVESRSGSRPHLVLPAKGSKFCVIMIVPTLRVLASAHTV